jgi:hypothetical protein
MTCVLHHRHPATTMISKGIPEPTVAIQPSFALKNRLSYTRAKLQNATAETAQLANSTTDNPIHQLK